MNSYEKKSDQIRELANLPPDKLLGHFADKYEDVTNVSPTISSLIQGVANRGLQYLNNKMPKPRQEFAGDEEWEPSTSQKEEWLQHYEAVDDPASVLDHVKNGTLTNAHLEALNAVHPNLLAEMKQKVMENASAKAIKSLPYSTKIAVSKFLGSPLDSSLAPQTMQLNQAVYAQQPSMGALGTPKRKSSTLGGLKELDLGKRAATETQELETDDD